MQQHTKQFFRDTKYKEINVGTKQLIIDLENISEILRCINKFADLFQDCIDKSKKVINKVRGRDLYGLNQKSLTRKGEK